MSKLSERVSRVFDSYNKCQEENKRLQMENDTLKAYLAESEYRCIYCHLPSDQMSRCPSGFPGCGRADDWQMGVSLGIIKEPKPPEENPNEA